MTLKWKALSVFYTAKCICNRLSAICLIRLIISSYFSSPPSKSRASSFSDCTLVTSFVQRLKRQSFRILRSGLDCKIWNFFFWKINMLNFTLNGEIKLKEQKWMKLEFHKENRDSQSNRPCLAEVGRRAENHFPLFSYSTTFSPTSPSPSTKEKTDTPFRVGGTSK